MNHRHAIRHTDTTGYSSNVQDTSLLETTKNLAKTPKAHVTAHADDDDKPSTTVRGNNSGSSLGYVWDTYDVFNTTVVFKLFL
jgi:hypothetical protein